MVEMAIVIVLIGISIVLLCIRMIFKKNGQFSSQHISENARMKKDGIHCATSQDRAARRNKKTKIDVRQM
jgi:hypothetical protein